MEKHREEEGFGKACLGLFGDWFNRINAGEVTREGTEEVMEAYGIENPKAPLVLMFNAFCAGVDAGIKVTVDYAGEEKAQQANKA